MSSYVFTSNKDEYEFKKIDGTLLTFPNNGSKWSLMKQPDNKYSWIPANDLSNLKIDCYKIDNNNISIKSCLFFIVTYTINNIAYYANTENKSILHVSNSTDSIEYKLVSYTENNQLVVPFYSNEGIIKDNSETKGLTTIKLLNENEYITLNNVSVFSV